MSASKGKKRRARNTKPDKHRDSEAAAELAPLLREREGAGRAVPQEEETATGENHRILGWLALALSVASLFVLPQWFGLAGIVLGGAAWFTNARGLGIWSIIIGSISLLAYIVLFPYYS